MLSLTDMWKAARSPEDKRPAEWARKQGAEFIAFMGDTLNMATGHIYDTRRGRYGGGTWAHWQIAMAFAQSLSAEFHAYCNTVVREHLERMREGRLPLQAPGFNADAFTRADARELMQKYIGTGRSRRLSLLVPKSLVNQGLPVRRTELEEKMRVVVALADVRVGLIRRGAR